MPSLARCLDWVPVAGHIGLKKICNWLPDAFEESSGIRGSSETATSGTWFSDLHLKFVPSFINDGDSPFSNHKSSPFLRTINTEIALLVRANSMFASINSAPLPSCLYVKAHRQVGTIT